MKYRINKRTGDRISEIGIGSSYMFGAGMDEAVRALRRAVEGGINYFDLAAGDGTTFPIYGEALHDVRKNLFFQIHFGADYSKGTYGWSLDLDTIKRSVDNQLRALRTDYIDYGFIHCQDELSDWETYRKNGVYDYIRQLQKGRRRASYRAFFPHAGRHSADSGRRERGYADVLGQPRL